MEILHLIKLTGANVSLENIDINDTEKRNSLVEKTPTTTLPLLETKEGNISKSRAINYYLCSKYKPELLGETEFERAKVNQWIEFACLEINNCNKSIIYPLFGWSDFCKEKYDQDNSKIKEHLKLIEKELSKNEYIVGKKLTLADITLFRYLRCLMMFHFPEKMRKNLFPKTEKWFEKMMKTPEAVEGYGDTVLCKTPMKANAGKNDEKHEKKDEKHEKKDEKHEKKDEKHEKKGEKHEKKDEKPENNDEKNEKKDEKTENNDDKKECKEEKGKKKKKNKKDKGQEQDKKDKGQGNKKKDKAQEKNQGKELVKEVKKEEEYVPSMLELPRFNIKKKENNPLDALPESKFDLEKFKKDFVNNPNKKEALDNFWKNYDPEGYSLWFIDYNKEPNEFITLLRAVIAKGDILLQLEHFKKYCFGVLGVYGGDGDYTIRGCLMWRGKDIPDEIKEINCYNKLTLKKLDPDKDQQLVHDYWTKINQKETVFEKKAIDTRYFY